MAVYRYPLIAKEGWLLIAVVAMVALALHYFAGSILFAGIAWAIVIFLLYVFRDPTRKIPPSPLGIISPVDGEVIAVDEIHDDYLDRDVKRISLNMNTLGVRSIRSPTEGKIQNRWFNAGSEKRPRHALWIQTDEKDDVLIEMIPPKFPPPVCEVQSGERVGQGARCGFVYFAGQINLFLPTDARIQVAVGDHVVGGSDIVATLHK
jgi:phosphatidylserine decarboxylase